MGPPPSPPPAKEDGISMRTSGLPTTASVTLVTARPTREFPRSSSPTRITVVITGRDLTTTAIRSMMSSDSRLESRRMPPTVLKLPDSTLLSMPTPARLMPPVPPMLPVLPTPTTGERKLPDGKTLMLPGLRLPPVTRDDSYKTDVGQESSDAAQRRGSAFDRAAARFGANSNGQGQQLAGRVGYGVAAAPAAYGYAPAAYGAYPVKGGFGYGY